MSDETPYDQARAAFGFPRFAEPFPRTPELDALVVAFARGDYATVREGAPKLAASTDDPEVAKAAKLLRARLDADPGAKILFLATAALLAFLTAWWVAHDGPPGGERAKPAPPAVEYVK